MQKTPGPPSVNVYPHASSERGAHCRGLALEAHLEARIVLLVRGEPGALCAHGRKVLQRCQDGAPALGLLLGLSDLLGHLGHHLRHLHIIQAALQCPHMLCRAASDSQPVTPHGANFHCLSLTPNM